MRRLWLIFAQAVTVSLAILFVVTTLRPDWLRLSGPGRSPPPGTPGPDVATAPVVPRQGELTFAPAVARAAMDSGVAYTAKHVDVPLIPLPDDPVIRELLGQLPSVSRRHESTSLGSGVIVQERYVLTNYHVVEAADAIEVALADGRETRAQVVGADPETDLAVLKLPEHIGTVPVATLGSDGSLKVGDVVLAIGNPFGVGQTTTQGIVSALGRSSLGLNTYENFIQTDAAINPGNSGGPLVNMKGEVVGINTFIFTKSGGSEGIGFAIPVDAAKKVVDELIKYGKVRNVWIGVRTWELTPYVAERLGTKDRNGLYVSVIERGSPADKAGIKVGDIIRRVNNTPIRDVDEAYRALFYANVGDTISLSVERNGKLLTMSMALTELPE